MLDALKAFFTKFDTSIDPSKDYSSQEACQSRKKGCDMLEIFESLISKKEPDCKPAIKQATIEKVLGSVDLDENLKNELRKRLAEAPDCKRKQRPKPEAKYTTVEEAQKAIKQNEEDFEALLRKIDAISARSSRPKKT